MHDFHRFARLALITVSLAVAGPAERAAAQDAVPLDSYVRLHYVKQEHRIKMRDGVTLFTSVYSPSDTSQKHPILLKRTPYSVAPYGVDNYAASLGPSEESAKAGYIFVNQDVRGRFLSQGEFVQVTPHIADKKGPKDVDESSDTYDTIEWLIKNVPNNNGKVGMYGISYPGFYCSAGMIDHHPALVAVSPQAPVGDWFFDDFLHHGTFFLAHAYRWLSNNAQTRGRPSVRRATPITLPSTDGYKAFLEAGTIEGINKLYLKDAVPFWKEMMDHPNRDTFWQKRAILPHLKNVSPHVMTVGGWYDAEDLYGTFKTYQTVEAMNPNSDNVLVIGPWHHGGWASVDGDKLGNVSFGAKTSLFYRAEIELKFFEKYLKDKPLPAPAEATVFETGSNVWRTFDHWPPKSVSMKTVDLSPGGKLSLETPSSTGTAETFDEFVSDPAHPVPYTDSVTPRMTIEYMCEDQRFASRRPDVLCYQTEPMKDDLVLAGPIQVELNVSTSAQDADWVVKLIDVFPDAPSLPNGQPSVPMAGWQMMLRSESIRGRFRHGYDKPEPFTPGKPDVVKLELLDVLHRFQKGHRLMIQVQSTWFPLIDRNPQSWVDNIYYAKPESFTKATHRVYLGGQHPTKLTFPVLPTAPLPE